MKSRQPATYWLRFCAALLVFAVWFVLLWSTGFNATGGTGQMLINGLGLFALCLSLMAGVFLTADSLSSEKRGGTLGLLFLTDLRTLDVVLGKLAAHSLHAVFGLLAVVPILFLGVLVGSVTGHELARLSIVLCLTIVFSLALGIFVSAFSESAQEAALRTLTLVLVFAGLFPAIWWALSLALGRPAASCLLWPSPANTYYLALDAHYSTPGGPQQFWWSFALVALVALLSVICANIRLYRLYHREKGPEAEVKRTELRPSAAKRAAEDRAALLEFNPAYWMLSFGNRQRQFTLTLFGLALLWLVFIILGMTTAAPLPTPAAGLSATTFPISPPAASVAAASVTSADFFDLSLLLAYCLHLLVKLAVASESTRRMHADCQNGAMELLLVTPMDVKSILSGQHMALLKAFKPSLAILYLVNLVQCYFVLTQPIAASREAQNGFVALCLGGLFILLFDIYAIGWVGAWRGLNVAKPAWAIAQTLGSVMGIPWLMMFLFVAAEAGISNIRNDAPGFFAAWFVLCGIVDFTVSTRDRARLVERFRKAASERFGAKAA